MFHGKRTRFSSVSLHTLPVPVPSPSLVLYPHQKNVSPSHTQLHFRKLYAQAARKSRLQLSRMLGLAKWLANEKSLLGGGKCGGEGIRLYAVSPYRALVTRAYHSTKTMCKISGFLATAIPADFIPWNALIINKLSCRKASSYLLKRSCLLVVGIEIWFVQVWFLVIYLMVYSLKLA